MSDSPIQYRLIKKEKHTGARLGEIITPHGTFPTPMFMPGGSQDPVTRRAQANGLWYHLGQYLPSLAAAGR